MGGIIPLEAVARFAKLNGSWKEPYEGRRRADLYYYDVNPTRHDLNS